MLTRQRSIYAKYLNPEVVSRLGKLDLIARLVVEGFIIGLHKSPYHGFSVEFAEHRQYMPGDELKYIDWKAYGRSERYYVKEFEEETNLKCYILLDISASMGYTSRKLTKLQYGVYLAAALAYLMIHQQDAVGLVTFDQKIRSYLPPRAVRSYLKQILLVLHRARASRKTKIGDTFHEMAERIKRRGLVIVISDLFDDPEAILSGLKHFRHNKHEVIVFHVLDPQERRFRFGGEVIFEDLETRQQISTQPEHIAREYRQEMEQFLQTIRHGCLDQQTDYVLLETSTPYDKALFEYLVKRKKLG
jgi:uncharacterized protein (DUF58 family)